MSFTLPFVQLTEFQPQGAILPQAPADVPVFIFCSSAGTNFQVVQKGSQQQGAAEVAFGAGTVREGYYIAAKCPVPTVWIKVPATAVNAQASAVDHSGVTGTATHFVVGGTILDGYDVVVDWSIGGTFGTSATYKVSLDGRNTFGSPITQGASLTVQITGTLNGVSIATGITVTVTTSETVIANDVIKFFTLPPSASILPQVITRVNSSTATITPSGTPNDKYEVQIVFGSTTGARVTVGNVGLTYDYTLDNGYTWTRGNAVPTSGIFTLADHQDNSGVTHQTGLTITLGVGNIDPLDQIVFGTTPPVPAWADIATAMDAVRASTAAWSGFYVCGSSAVGTRNSAETKMQGYASSGRYTWTAFEGRDLIAGERVTGSPGNLAGDTAWGNRIAGTGLDGWGSSVGNRTWPSFGYTRITCPLTARRQRRPYNADLMAQLLAFTPDTNPGEYDNGPLTADVSITDQNGAPAEHDARTNTTIYAMGGNVIRTWEGEQGVLPGLWPADGHLMSTAGDMTDITQRRVLNLADAALLVGMRQNVLGKFGVNPSTARSPLVPGQIQPWELKRMNQALKRQVVSAVAAFVSGGAAGIFVAIDPNPNAGGPGILAVTMQLNGKQYIRGFKAAAGFVNPAVTAIVTPAS